MTPQPEPLDCRSEEGIIVGLIDGMIAQSRIVARYLRANVASYSVLEALDDLRGDEDVARVLRRARSSEVLR